VLPLLLLLLLLPLPLLSSPLPKRLSCTVMCTESPGDPWGCLAAAAAPAARALCSSRLPAQGSESAMWTQRVAGAPATGKRGVSSRERVGR
jgi:hypothetical protein